MIKGHPEGLHIARRVNKDVLFYVVCFFAKVSRCGLEVTGFFTQCRGVREMVDSVKKVAQFLCESLSHD
jgi:hypothetical protein